MSNTPITPDTVHGSRARVCLAVALVSLLWCTGNLAKADEAKKPRPNVLFIVSDDLNNFLGCYGDPRAKTPHLDRLAARGVRFEHAYCTFPLCGPSRNSFLTGMYPNSTGILTNGELFRQSIPKRRSLPQAFRQSGYFAARIGKLFHYGVPLGIGTNGHDDPASWEVEANPAGVDRLEELPKTFTLVPGQFGGTLSWYASPKSDEHHTDAKNADDAKWILERCAKRPDHPFFLAVGFFRPHTPYIAPKDPYFGYYPRTEMPLIENVEQDQKDIPPAGLASYRAPKALLPDELQRDCKQAYYASISFMDAQVGKVIDTLDRLGLADNTVIVFTSDHGYHMGEHGLWQKMSLFEESSRVPLLIVAPGRAKAGSVVQAPVSHVDLYATLIDLCQIKTADPGQGQSLVPMLTDSSVVGRGWALTQVTRTGRSARIRSGGRVSEGRFFGYSLRTPRWRYTEWDEGNEGRELYDHDNDPRELTNLADKPAQQETVAELSKQLRAAVQTTFPLDGKRPAVKGSMWSPDLTVADE